MTGTKTSRLSVDLTPAMLAALEARAEVDGQSKASIIRSALRAELREELRAEAARGKIVQPECRRSDD